MTLASACNRASASSVPSPDGKGFPMLSSPRKKARRVNATRRKKAQGPTSAQRIQQAWKFPSLLLPSMGLASRPPLYHDPRYWSTIIADPTNSGSPGSAPQPRPRKHPCAFSPSNHCQCVSNLRNKRGCAPSHEMWINIRNITRQNAVNVGRNLPYFARLLHHSRPQPNPPRPLDRLAPYREPLRQLSQPPQTSSRKSQLIFQQMIEIRVSSVAPQACLALQTQVLWPNTSPSLFPGEWSETQRCCGEPASRQGRSSMSGGSAPVLVLTERRFLLL